MSGGSTTTSTSTAETAATSTSAALAVTAVPYSPELATTTTNLDSAIIPTPDAGGVAIAFAETVATRAANVVGAVGQGMRASNNGTTRLGRSDQSQPDDLAGAGLEKLAVLAAGVLEDVVPQEWDRLAEVLPMDLSAVDRAVENFALQADGLNTAVSELLDLLRDDGVSQVLAGVVFSAAGGIVVHRLLGKERVRTLANVNDDESTLSWLLGATSFNV